MKLCTYCLGKKEYLGLGNLRKKCHVCNGVGFINDVPEEKLEEPPKRGARDQQRKAQDVPKEKQSKRGSNGNSKEKARRAP